MSTREPREPREPAPPADRTPSGDPVPPEERPTTASESTTTTPAGGTRRTEPVEERRVERRPDRGRTGAGTSALVIGVLALVLALLVFLSPIALLLGLIAIILGAIGNRRVSRGEADNRGAAVGGLITGLLAFIISAVLLATAGTFVFNHANDFRSLQSCMNKADTAKGRSTCIRNFSNNVNQ